MLVEEVFKVSGVPTHTFVAPRDFNQLVVALRSPGRGVVVEGPSGIGKSTAVERALGVLQLAGRITKLSARVPADVDYISLLPELSSFGLVVVDDFHRLPNQLREDLADLLKALADGESAHSKLVIIGINDAGKSLVRFAPDLANRIDVIKMETESPDRIDELVRLGEEALNVRIKARAPVIDGAAGSFYIAQLLCRDMCIKAGVTVRPDATTGIETSYSSVRAGVLARQETRFGDALRSFARGTKFRPGGRAPYLRILNWLAESDDWSISLPDEMARHPQDKPSINVVIEQGYLETLVAREEIAKILHYDRDTKTLSIEDPHLAYVLRNQDWPSFVSKCGFTKIDFPTEYDIALSFAGEDRPVAEALFYSLQDRGLTVFYDKNEQHRILAEDVEAYLTPMYQDRSALVVAILGEMYGVKRWTLFEARVFRSRIERREVVPVWSTKVPAGAFDATRGIGGLSFDPGADPRLQAEALAEVISKKLE
jgi:hypothetical protein